MEWTEAIRQEGLPLRKDGDAGVPASAARGWPQSIGEFESLVDALQHRLVQFAYCRLQSLPDAEDAVQDVLVRAYRDRAKYRDVACVEPFLFRMVANRATDVLRRRKWQAAPLDALPDAPAETASAGAPADTDARLRRVEALLGRLPRRQAEVIRLRVYADLSFEAVARSVGCSVPTVKSRFRYGVQKLRKALTRQGGER